MQRALARLHENIITCERQRVIFIINIINLFENCFYMQRALESNYGFISYQK
jgi:hypothetical protein